MPDVYYGGREGQKLELEVDDDLIAVRTRSRRSLRGGPVSPPAAGALEDFNLVASFPEAGVEVFRRPAATSRSVQTAKAALQASPDTEFAGRVLVDKLSRRPVLYTENLFVKFDDDLDEDECRTILRTYGLAVKRPLTYATNSYFVEAPEGIGQTVFEVAERLLAQEGVDLCHPELVRELGRRTIFPEQWHLKTTVVNGQEIRASASVEAAHATTKGAGVVIAVIDTGIDMDHEEFQSAGKLVAPRDATSGDDNPRPVSSQENHGTACAGVACADGRFGASGVAPEARLMPIRMISQLGSQAEADAFVWAADHGADVISCSWGPVDGRWWDPTDPAHAQVVPMPDSTRLAVDHAATQGRGGKGCIILFAAGNGNEPVGNDGYASYDKILAVAASNDRSRRSAYSDFGPAVFCAFPSNDFEFPEEGRPAPLTPGIWTTDVTGPRGYSSGKYTDDFGGTSSACPGAAGVVALVLACRPSMRREQAKELLAGACDRIDPQDGDWDASGFSPKYGHGRLNAEQAVALASAEPGTVDEVVVARTFNEPITDFQTTSVTLEVGETAPLVGTEVAVEIEHTYIGDLVVSVLPPPALGAAPVVLHRRTGGRTRNLNATFASASVPGLAALAGASPAGVWTLEVRDEAAVDVGAIKRFAVELTVQRAEPTPPPPTRRRRAPKTTAKRSGATKAAASKAPVRTRSRRRSAP